MAVLRSGRSTSSSSSSNSQSLGSSDRLPAAYGRWRRMLPPWLSKSPKPLKRACTTKERHDGVRPYAMDAITAYNETTGTKYELVEPGFLTTKYIGKCMLHHIDFTAKKTDVADAPEEMFFAELTSILGVRCVKLCKCMGPKDSISGDKNYGCRYCRTHNVQHPSDGGFKTGQRLA